MFRCLEMELNTGELDYRKASSLQGVLFERMLPEYAKMLHEQRRHPYSQYLVGGASTTLWRVNTLDEEANRQILQPLLSETFTSFELKKAKQVVAIKSKHLRELDQGRLMEEFYNHKAERYFHVSVLTPAAFKQRGRYVIYPDLRLLYQSLMNKYSAVLEDMDMMDEDTLEALAQGSGITAYRLRSVRFPMEGITIPSFVGTFTVKVSGTDTMARYVRMLFRFGEYAGIGIKTAMGMGAMRLLEREGS